MLQLLSIFISTFELPIQVKIYHNNEDFIRDKNIFLLQAGIFWLKYAFQVAIKRMGLKYRFKKIAEWEAIDEWKRFLLTTFISSRDSAFRAVK